LALGDRAFLVANLSAATGSVIRIMSKKIFMDGREIVYKKLQSIVVKSECPNRLHLFKIFQAVD
jgi:hypothetical protein